MIYKILKPQIFVSCIILILLVSQIIFANECIEIEDARVFALKSGKLFYLSDDATVYLYDISSGQSLALYQGSFGEPFAGERKVGWVDKWVDPIKIYLYDIIAGDIQTINTGIRRGGVCVPDTDDQTLVYSGNKYVDLSLGITYQAPIWFWAPKVEGKYIVGEPHDPYGYGFDAYVYDIQASEVRQLTEGLCALSHSFHIKDGKVVWRASSICGHEPVDLYFHDIETGVTIKLTDETWHALSFPTGVVDFDGKRIVWSAKDNDNNQEIFLYDILTKTITQISHEKHHRNTNPCISESKIVWNCWDGNDLEICVYDIPTGESYRLTYNGDSDGPPIIEGKYVTWTRRECVEKNPYGDCEQWRQKVILCDLESTTIIPNHPPVIQFSDICLNENEISTAVICGSAIDPDADTLQYRWHILSPWKLVGVDGHVCLDLKEEPLWLHLGENILKLEVFDGDIRETAEVTVRVYRPQEIIRQIIGPTGGTISTVNVSSDISGATIEIPPEALSENVEITISEIKGALSPFPEDIIGIGSPVHFGPEGLVFNKPVTIKLPYTEEDLENTGVSDPQELDVYTFNTTTSTWELVEGPKTVDEENMLVMIDVTHFSIFQLGVRKVAIQGDLDSDGDVDQNDLNILLTYRNQPASACPGCDLDGDGVITVLDARKLVLMCTRPRCATE